MAGKAILAGLLMAMTLVAGLQSSAYCGGGDKIKLEARLRGQGTPASGKAKFEKKGSRMKLSVEVEDFVSAPGVADISIGGFNYTVTLDATGFGDLNLDTRNGNAVPDLSGGAAVTVSVGNEVISGSF